MRRTLYGYSFGYETQKLHAAGGWRPTLAGCAGDARGRRNREGVWGRRTGVEATPLRGEGTNHRFALARQKRWTPTRRGVRLLAETRVFAVCANRPIAWRRVKGWGSAGKARPLPNGRRGRGRRLRTGDPATPAARLCRGAMSASPKSVFCLLFDATKRRGPAAARAATLS